VSSFRDRPNSGSACGNVEMPLTPHKSVAVIGGGISGLSTAWFLSKLLPKNVPITLFEASPRVGGWVQTKSFDLEDGRVCFELGPRTLRPSGTAGKVTIDMLGRLGLLNEVIRVPKIAPASKNRYIYLDGKLNPLPSSIWSLATSLNSSILKGLGSLILEPFRSRRTKDLADESVHCFLTRRFDRRLADNIASAVFHGIYAGDIKQLSVRSTMPSLWNMESAHGSVLRGMLKAAIEDPADAMLLKNMETSQGLFATFDGTSTYSLKGGLNTIVNALLKDLDRRGSFHLQTKASVESIAGSNDDDELIVRVDNVPTSHSHVVSTLSAPDTNNLLPESMHCKELATVQSVNVMVINLFYKNPSLVKLPGFGYLIPQSVQRAENPEYALGVIFDSDCVPGQDTASGTKLTVMMGGHWWTDAAAIPDTVQAIAMARRVLERHLGIKDEPVLSNAVFQRSCIPQYTVGHHQRMEVAHWHLKEHFHGRLSVLGSSYCGVGVNDVVRSARRVATNIAENNPITGLEAFAKI